MQIASIPQWPLGADWRRIDAVPGVEWMRYRQDLGGGLLAHVPTEFGFVMVDEGLDDVRTRGRMERVGPGLYWVQPGEPVVVTARYANTTRLRAITIDPAIIATAASKIGIDHHQMAMARFANEGLRLRNALEALWWEATNRRDGLHVQTAFTRFLQATFEVASDARTAQTSLQSRTPGLRRAQARILEGSNREITLDALASEAGTTKWHFVRSFRRAFGMTPYAYLMHVRVEHARRLLARGYRPVEVAAELYFSDQSHLHRWFLKSVGLSPSAYQKCIVLASHLPEKW